MTDIYDTMSESRAAELADAAAEYKLKCAAIPHALEMFRLLARAEVWIPEHNQLFDEISAIISKIRSEA